MWWWDKEHPLAVYMDRREVPQGTIEIRPNWHVSPDVIGDFRAMPFEDESFQLVVFDPPHIIRENESESFLRTKYGELHPETAEEDLARGFSECWRVLAAGGTLVFKWAGDARRVEPYFPTEPIVGTRSARGSQTYWFIFYKALYPQDRAERAVQTLLGASYA